jgi:alkyl hydroperoxide reductase subunit AhpF
MPEPIISAELNQHFESISASLEAIASSKDEDEEEKNVTALLAHIDDLAKDIVKRQTTEVRNTPSQKIRSALRTAIELAFTDRTRKILEALDTDPGPHGPGCACPRVMH